jgi:starch synthase
MIGYNEELAHLVQAGADSVLVPSRYEPCGLTQLCALHYGAIPLVANVGGLADTVIDPERAEPGLNDATGIQFSPVTQEALEGALLRIAAIWTDKKQWQQMQVNGMRADVSWKKSGVLYAELYAEVLAAKK